MLICRTLAGTVVAGFGGLQCRAGMGEDKANRQCWLILSVAVLVSLLRMRSLSDFQIYRQVCEARMPQRFVFWDYSGRLWAAVTRVIPDLKVVAANPAHTEFASDDLLLVAETGVIRATARGTVRHEEFLKKTADFFHIAIDMLEIDVFERLGYRIIYTQDFPSMKEAAAGFTEFKLLSLPQPSIFGVEEPPEVLGARVTWENDDVAFTLDVRTEKRNTEPQIPWEMKDQMNASGTERSLLVVDVDRYTKKSVSRGQLSIEEWINNSHRNIKKSLSKGLF